MASEHAALRRQNRPNHPLLKTRYFAAGPVSGVLSPWRQSTNRQNRANHPNITG